MRPDSYSSWDDGEAPSAPPPPQSPAYSDDSDMIAPQWVQRLYGPPPPRQPTPYHQRGPQPAPDWGGAPQTWQEGQQQWHTPGPIQQQYPQYEVQAFSPGTYPRGGPGMLRERSPSAATFIVAESGGDSHGYGRPPPAEGSPTKTPLLVTAADLAHGPASHGGTGEEAAHLGDDVNRPSRALALRRRNLLQLRTCDKDAFGVPLPKTSRPFSLSATPNSIAEVCTGLGVYLASLQAAVLLALLLSLCAIYPLVDNLNTQRWPGHYTLHNQGSVSEVVFLGSGWQ